MSVTSRLAAGCAALGLVALTAHAITKNWVADNDHPFVGLIVFYDVNGEFTHRCSGSLISPTKFVTAGHCTEPGTGAVTARVYFQQDAGAHFDPATGVDPISGYPETCAGAVFNDLCTTASVLRDFSYTGLIPDTRDVGVAILDRPIWLGEYGTLASAGTLNRLSTARGTKGTIFTVSGYGLTLRTNDHSPLPNLSFRSRLQATSTLVNLNSALNDGFNLQTQGNGDARGGTCSGDSGGPVFLGDANSNVIVGVTSFGLNPLCRGTDFAYRTDRQVVIDWINAQQ